MAASIAAALMPALSISAAVFVPLAVIGAVWYGLRRYRPSVRMPWVMLGAASLLALGHLGSTGYLGGYPPFPSFGDGLHVGAYLCLWYGLLTMAKPPSGRPAWEAAIDAGVVTSAAVVASWTFVVDPILSTTAIGGSQLVGVLGYAGLDLLLLGVAARTAFLTGLRTPASALLVLGVATLLGTDTAWFVGLGPPAAGGSAVGLHVLDLKNVGVSGVGALLGGVGVWTAAGWAVANLLLAAAAVHPSMADAGRRADPSGVVFSRARLKLYILLTLVIPAVTIGYSVQQGTSGVPAARLVVPLLASAAMSILLLLRVSQLATVAQRRATELDDRTVALGNALQEQEVLQHELRHRALHDPLTALGNRALLNERLNQALCRVAPGRMHGLFLLDLDGFKEINDTLGHPAGDLLLIEVADRLRKAVPGGTTLVRLGGDEFAIILTNSSIWELRATAETVLTAIRAPYRLAGQLRVLTTSIGVRAMAEPTRPTDALHDADIALYAAKAAGKNQIRVYEPARARR